MSGGNYVAYNLGLNPAVNFNFMLRVEGVFDLPCKSVRAFQKENEYEYIQEGGLNDYVHMRRKPISKPFTIQIERYVGVDMLDPLANGTELVLPLILYVNRYSVYKEFHPVRTYVFSGCTVMSKEYGELNAEQSGLLVETTTIAYREMYTLENIATSFVTEDTWEFNGTSKEGRGKRKANTGGHGEKESSKAAMAEKAKKWIFSGGNTHKELSRQEETGEPKDQEAIPAFMGIGHSSKSAEDSYKKEIRKASMPREKYSFKENYKENLRAKTDENEATIEERRKEAKKWTFSGGNTEKAIKENEKENHLISDNEQQTGVQASPGFLGNNALSKSAEYTRTQEVRKSQMPNSKYKYKEDKTKNKRAVINEAETSKETMEGKAKKYDIVMNTGKSAKGSDGAREKKAFEKQAKRWPDVSSAMTVEKFMNTKKMGGKQ